LTSGNGIGYQHDLSGRSLAIVAVRASTNRLEDLQHLLGAITEALETIRPGMVVEIG